MSDPVEDTLAGYERANPDTSEALWGAKTIPEKLALPPTHRPPKATLELLTNQ